MSFCGFSQEILTGMQMNSLVRQKYLRDQMSAPQRILRDTTPVGLPFFDDFSYDSIYPSSKLWADNYTFVNTDIPIYPPNRGAVTLDAIDEKGLIYSNALPGPTPFIADYLTSRYIRLDSVFSPASRKLRAADSVFLSFYYQPQGRSANAPLTEDSLILRFLVNPAHDSITPIDTIHVPDLWMKVWSTIGMSLDTFKFYNQDKYFVQVIIPITDTMRFFKKTFRFQFYNYVNFAAPPEYSWESNCDQWSIDNVYLNINRNGHDTILPEIRFLDRAPSMLRNYESMPYPQYSASPDQEMADSVTVTFSNRDISIRNCKYGYTVTNPSGTFSKNYSGPNLNVMPYYSAGPVLEHPPVPFFYPIVTADSAVFTMTHIVHDNAAGSLLGDTIRGQQKLYNYFAYDDGTPEASYGLTPAGSMLAYRFSLDKPDTLRAVQMYFNHVLNNQNVQFFFLCVWNDNAGTPGDTIYSKLTIPQFSDQLNTYFTYPVPSLPVNGTIYIGWIQTTSDNLCLGFDRYNDHSAQIFYNTTGKWYPTSYNGSLMIRPVVGKPLPLGINETQTTPAGLLIYPNPCSAGSLHLELTGKQSSSCSDFRIRVTDLPGRIVISSLYTGTLDVSALQQGLYIVQISDSSGKLITARKLIISQ